MPGLCSVLIKESWNCTPFSSQVRGQETPAFHLNFVHWSHPCLTVSRTPLSQFPFLYPVSLSPSGLQVPPYTIKKV